MSAMEVEAGAVEGLHLTDGVTLRSWLLTTDHKRIALLYLGSITMFFFVGGAAAAFIRYNLITPQGMIASAEACNRVFTAHGVVMVWFSLVPAVPVTLGNFIVSARVARREGSANTGHVEGRRRAAEGRDPPRVRPIIATIKTATANMRTAALRRKRGRTRVAFAHRRARPP
jgi:Cytochrome C and Quinol oxidase polypeptide I